MLAYLFLSVYNQKFGFDRMKQIQIKLQYICVEHIFQKIFGFRILARFVCVVCICADLLDARHNVSGFVWTILHTWSR